MSRRPVPATHRKVHRPRDCDDRNPHSVYRIYNADDELMYVGVAHDVIHRLYMHEAAAQSSWASMQMVGRIERWTSVQYPTKAAARAAEREAIHAEAPLYNRQHNPKRWRRVAGQYERVLTLNPQTPSGESQPRSPAASEAGAPGGGSSTSSAPPRPAAPH